MLKLSLVALHLSFCQYLKYERGKTDKTAISYKYDFDEFVRWLEENRYPVKVSSLADHLIPRAFMYDLFKRKLKSNTVRRRMLSLKSFCRFLLRDDHLQRNPFDKFDVPRKGRSLPKPVNDSNRDKLLDLTKRRAVSSKKERDIQAVVMMELGFRSGMRKGAMKSLLLEDIDFKCGLGSSLDKGQVMNCYTLAPSTIHWIKALMHVRGKCTGNVLLSPKSKTPISSTSLHDEFKRYVRLCGINDKEANLHMLRHTFATNLLGNGMDIREVQEAMCHKDIGSTVCYTEVSKSTLREKISRKVFSGAKR